MKKYFLLQVSMHYVTKNALQKAIQEYIDSIDRSVIEFETLENWIDSFNQSIDAICDKFPRCKREKVSSWGIYEKDFHISIAQTRVNFFSFQK